MKLNKKQLELVAKANFEVQSAQGRMNALVQGMASAMDLDDEKDYTLDLEKGAFVEVKKDKK